MVLDKLAAVQEMVRILKPASRLVLTTWEPDYLDHRTLLRSAGLDVLVREETPDWLSRQIAVYDGILAARGQLAAELGPDAAEVLVAEARETPPLLADTPRILVAAVRRG
jgi:SAM-dependent methyltransferase